MHKLTNKSITELVIGGCEYSVEWLDDPWRDAPMGRARFASQSIGVLATLAPDQARSTLLHEAIEIINESCELGLAHSQICTLEFAIDAVLKANPAFARLAVSSDRRCGTCAACPRHPVHGRWCGAVQPARPVLEVWLDRVPRCGPDGRFWRDGVPRLVDVQELVKAGAAVGRRRGAGG